MEHLPAFSAQPAYPAGSGGQRQRQHQREGGHPGRNKAALHNVMQHLLHVEKFVEPHVGGQVQGAIEEGKQAEHPAQANEPGKRCQFAYRGNAQRYQQEYQRPFAGGAGNHIDWVRPQILLIAFPYQQSQRRQAEKKYQHLQGAHEWFPWGFHQKYFFRSIPE